MHPLPRLSALWRGSCYSDFTVVDDFASVTVIEMELRNTHCVVPGCLFDITPVTLTHACTDANHSSSGLSD